MAKSFSDMGALSQIFGMDKLSLATVRGYFATEIGTIHSLGSAMFSAAMATVILSKEEDGHTAEFTFTLPVSRIKIIAMKYLAVLSNLVSFAIICMVLYQISFVFIGADNMGSDFYRFMFLQFMMNALCTQNLKYVETNLNLENNALIQNSWKNFPNINHKRRRCFIKNLKK